MYLESKSKDDFKLVDYNDGGWVCHLEGFGGTPIGQNATSCHVAQQNPI